MPTDPRGHTSTRNAPAVWALHIATADEPPTAALLARVLERGAGVLLPVLLADDDLDWARWDGESPLVPGRRGLLEPPGPRLGPRAVAGADVLIVPGLAVDGAGHRLGRGGGSYDRALARRSARSVAAVLLWPDEVGLPVPVEPHDRLVDAAITPEGIHVFRAPGPAADLP